MPNDASHSRSGQVLFAGIDGATLLPSVREWLQRVRPGGIIIFKRNVESLPGLAELCSSLKRLYEPAPLLAIDEEGGRVTRIAPHVQGLPSAAAVAGAAPDRLRGYWRRYGELLFRLGFDIDFAPVADLCASDAPNGIAERSYGTDPEAVISCAGAAMEGLLEAGILPTLKHFPGLGDTLLDSHHHLPSSRKRRDAFEREDLAPFRRLAPRAPAVMIGHGHYPFYSGADPVAATLSKEVSTDLLRTTIGYGGCAISDDLEMKAVAVRVPWDELAPRAIEAGNDMLLICHSSQRILASLDAIERRAAADGLFRSRLDEAIARVGALREAALRARGAAAPATGVEEARTALLAEASALTSAVA